MTQSAVIIISLLGSAVALLSVAVFILFRTLYSINQDLIVLSSAVSTVCRVMENTYRTATLPKNE
jgi:hypothetical protein